MSYVITQETFTGTYLELEPLYRQHYSEMTDRLNKEGFEYSPYNLRLDQYGKSCKAGDLLNFVLRHDGVACGYSNLYLTNDMHNHDLIAQEDTIYVVKEHRNGIGMRLAKHCLEELRSRGVKRLHVSAMTDPRAVKFWSRIGFKEASVQMIYRF